MGVMVVRATRSMRTGTSALPALALSYRIKEQRIGRQRLAAILRAKAKENDAAFAHSDFDQGGFAFDTIASEQPAGKQRVFVFRIPGDDAYVRGINPVATAPGSDNLKHRRVLNPGD